MPTKCTFVGPTYRIQLQVFDYTDGVIPQWISKPIHWAVDRLPNSLPKSTEFSTGDQLYYGPDLKVAIDCVRGWIWREPELPKWVRRYMEGK